MRHLDLLVMLTTMALPLPARWRRRLWNGWVRITPWITAARRRTELGRVAPPARRSEPQRSTAES
jgi:hypothetical protein